MEKPMKDFLRDHQLLKNLRKKWQICKLNFYLFNENGEYGIAKITKICDNRVIYHGY